MAGEFISQLAELRNVVMERLLTTPLEVLRRKELIEDVQTNTENINAAYEKSCKELAELAASAEQKVCSQRLLLLSASVFVTVSSV